MRKITELLPSVWEIELNAIQDLRGSFVKSFAKTAFDSLAPDFQLHEEYYSISKKDVLRGMHFQTPPYDHLKIVYCIHGKALDVLLDLRCGPTYGSSRKIVLDASSPTLLVIPKGVAHGFRSLVDGTTLVYKTTAEHMPDNDAGILWSSFNLDWGLDRPILSERDTLHPNLKDFVTPF